MRNLETRLKKLEATIPTDPMERAQAIVRAMSIEEINTELRACMLKGGFNPILPLDEALATYIAKREAELVTLSATDQECCRQYLALVRKGGTDRIRAIFPESTRQTMEVCHV